MTAVVLLVTVVILLHLCVTAGLNIFGKVGGLRQLGVLGGCSCMAIEGGKGLATR